VAPSQRAVVRLRRRRLRLGAREALQLQRAAGPPKAAELKPVAAVQPESVVAGPVVVGLRPAVVLVVAGLELAAGARGVGRGRAVVLAVRRGSGHRSGPRCGSRLGL
jgi:hypothetical protein